MTTMPSERLDLVARRLSGGRAADAPPHGFRRRDFLKVAALAGGGLAVAWTAPATFAAEEAATPAAPPKHRGDPSAFVTIRPDNRVEIAVNRLDFGQGALTALPMLIAEELDVEWHQVSAHLAPAAEVYKDPLFGLQMTGGSTAVNNSWVQYREIGAATRQMLVAAAAEQWQVPASQCTTAAGEVRCGQRRASYASLAAAAARQSVPDQVTLKRAADYRIIGHGQGRLDAREGASGRKVYGMDFHLPGMKIAMLLHAPTFGGQVESFDEKAARAVPGVREVFTVATDRGGLGIAVIADGNWAARQARERLAPVWKNGVGANASSDALLTAYREEAQHPKSTVVDTPPLAGAVARRVGGEFWFPYLAHAPMEPLNATFAMDKGRATVWAGSQFQTIDQMAVAQVLGLDPGQVTLNTMPAGGGFGRRAVPSSDYLREGASIFKTWRERQGESAEALKIVWSREDDIRGGYYRPAHLHRVDVALDAQGKMLSWDHAIVGQSILRGTPFEAFMVKNGVDQTMIEGVPDNPYGLPLRLRISHSEVAVPVLWWRSVGHSHTAFVVETVVDEIARAAGADPVEWRLARLDEKEHARHIAALKLAVARSGYGRPLPAGHAFGVAVHEAFGSVVAHVVDVSIVDGRPKVHRVTAGVHANRIVNPLAGEAQIQGGAIFGLAATLPGFEIVLKDGVVQQSQFTDYPPPRMPDAPVVDVHFVPSEDPPTGLGEPGVPPIAPAIANAVAALTGKRLRRLPFDLTSA